jgi:hypothetical protein
MRAVASADHRKEKKVTKTARQMALYERMESIRERDGGRLTADAVWQDGRDDVASPLHREFTWDVDKAAEAHWRMQARRLIEECYIQVRVKTTTYRAPAYVRDQTASAREQGYVKVTDLKTDRDLSLEALEYEVRRARAALERARGVAIGLDLPTATVDEMLTELEQLMQLFGQAA